MPNLLGVDQRAATQRAAFAAVIDSFNKINESLGQVGAMDYARLSDGSGAQNATSDKGHQLIDFRVDVARAIDTTLTADDRQTLRLQGVYEDLDKALTTQPAAFMLVQEKLGRTFMSRGLFPVTEYFHIEKQGPDRPLKDKQ